MGVIKKLQFFGFRTDIPEILAATDIYVLPSLSEGLSISLLEAKAAGNACIVTDIGLPVENKKTALVVQQKNPDELAMAINMLMVDPVLRRNLGANAKRDASTNHDWKDITKEYLKFFNSIYPNKTSKNVPTSSSSGEP